MASSISTHATNDETKPTTSRSISGTVPGLLDPSQATRLLRHHSNTLFFAFFDPLTATSTHSDVPDLRKLSIHEDLCRPKRVVIETTASGDSFWRFVPKAQREDGCVDEGSWPRVVEICGELVECSLDQWDIYKLDPDYQCYVRMTPNRTVISHVSTIQVQQQPSRSTEPSSPYAPPLDSPAQSKSHSFKRPQTSQFPSPPEVKRHKFGLDASSTTSTRRPNDEEDAVDYMVIDDPLPPPNPPRTPGAHKRAQSAGPMHIHSRSKTRREETIRARMWRREKISERTHEKAKSVPPDTSNKRKAYSSDQTRASDLPNGVPNKRPRHVSPRTIQRLVDEKRIARERVKAGREKKKIDERRKAFEDQFMKTAFGGIPGFMRGGDTGHGSNDGADQRDRTQHTSESASSAATMSEAWGRTAKGPEHRTESSADADDKEARRLEAIAESIAKLAELERDRPLWEAQAKKRQAQEAAEEQARQVKAEERRQAAAREAEAAKRAKAEREEREEKERADADEREREEAAWRRTERRNREARWSSGPWTAMRALERYKILCDEFDGIRFSANDPLTFTDVPWPILRAPTWLTVEDVDWTAVEKFFEAVQPHMRVQDYKMFVEKSHRRFHPDRWRSRGLLKNVKDEDERACLEVAANTVAQALTPLWTTLKGR